MIKEKWYCTGQPCPPALGDGAWLQEEEEPWYCTGQPYPYYPGDGAWLEDYEK